MAAVQNKAHISIGGYAFLIAKQPRTGRHIYGRAESPHFVNKVSSGDPNYRDSSFFPHFVQNNWLNGFDQEKFNDGGKFYRSTKIDTTQEQKLTLEKAVSSVGSGTGNTKSFGQRSSSSQGWWNTNYQYRQQLTISAPASINVPSGYPIKVAIDTAALESGGKLLANRNDWRIIYTNGSSFTDITRDYINTTTTFFPLQAAISAGQTDNSYYIYYGYSSESTNKQPTTQADWNGVYPMFGSTPDAYSVAAYHFREGSGTTVADDAGNSHTLTFRTNSTGAPAWATDGLLGRYVSVNGVSQTYLDSPDTTDLDLSTMTLEALVYRDTSQEFYIFTHGEDAADKNFQWQVANTGKQVLKMADSGGEFSAIDTGTGSVAEQTWTWVAVTYDNAGNVKFYYNNVLSSTISSSNGTLISSTHKLLVNALYNSSNNLSSFGTNRISHARISNTVRTSFSFHLSATNQPTYTSGGEVLQASVSSSGTFEVYRGSDTGDIEVWDGVNTWTSSFNVRRLQWYDTVANKDTDLVLGDTGGTETAQAQSFQLTTASRVKAVEIYMKIATGTPSDVTVRIETDSSSKPSGTLADANLTATLLSSDVTSSYGFVRVEFTSASSSNLSASTTYWIVLKTAAAANDNNYNVGADGSSPSYSSGNMAHSTDGGTTWTADSADDMLFRVLAENAYANQIVQATFSSTTKLWIAAGDPSNTNSNNARLYTYDGSTWALAKTFTGTGSAAALSLQVYNSKLYVGLSPTAAIYVTSDGTTWSLSKEIDEPGNPGFVWDLEVYNGRLYACGGHPEYVITNNSQGFLYSYDEYSWTFVYDFSFTVLKSMAVFDNLLFLGTINKKLFVYNTASMDKLEDFPWDVSINWMTVYNDQLALGLGATNAVTGQEAVYLFDRNGFHNAYVPDANGINALFVARNKLLIGTVSSTVYEVDSSLYTSTGNIQLSYFEASLPSFDKLWRSIAVHFESLPTGCTITLDYKTDESDSSWTNIGTISTPAETYEEFTFTDTFYSKKITIRLTLATTDSSKTPTIKLVDMRYLVFPDFKYIWKLSIACPDNLVWLDNTQPISTTTAAITAGDTTLTLTDGTGFPTSGRAVVSDGTDDEFTWTGRTGNQLTGCSGLLDHTSTGLTVKINGASLHKQILTLKQTKQIYTLVDIDGLSYNVAFNSYQEDGFVVNQTDGIENNVPITLLEV